MRHRVIAVVVALALAAGGAGGCAGARGRNDDVPRPGEQSPARSGEFDE